MYSLTLGQPTTLAIAEAIERLRDLLYRQHGTRFALTVVADGAVLASHRPDEPRQVQACTREQR